MTLTLALLCYVVIGLAVAAWIPSGSTAQAVSIGAVVLLPTLLTWAVSGLRLEQRGRGTGIWTGSLFIGQFVSPVLVGIAAATLGGLPMALGVLGVLSAVAAVAAAIGRPQRHAVTE